ncbi:MAG: dihydroorotate dehydrogenase (quinone) [Acidimicrobiales bacterium]|nr:MAG: dihydroorotate dehydrogenase (quinone) [Acidimicrobiales bacterium]
MIYRFLFWLILSRLPAEAAHRLSFGLLRAVAAIPGARNVMRAMCRVRSPRLAVHAFGRRFDNPLGLAAGFDKDARGPAALTALGFGFIEVGTVTASPQPGNPKPRLFRLPADAALINRMGFNNAGAAAAVRSLAQVSGRNRLIIGVNIGKTKTVEESGAVDDYVSSARQLVPYADFLVVNVSSPNTPGLRNLQAVSLLRPLLLAMKQVIADDAIARSASPVPLLVKIAPDLADSDIDEVAHLALELELDGIVATNTSLSREGLRSTSEQVDALGAGGLSGAPLQQRSLEVLRRLRAQVGERITLVSVGGISSPEDAWQRICAGATLLQGYTGFIYGGPLWPLRIQCGLLARLDRAGIATLEQARGIEQL